MILKILKKLAKKYLGIIMFLISFFTLYNLALSMILAILVEIGCICVFWEEDDN